MNTNPPYQIFKSSLFRRFLDKNSVCVSHFIRRIYSSAYGNFFDLNAPVLLCDLYKLRISSFLNASRTFHRHIVQIFPYAHHKIYNLFSE
jgi:hypothetical protein